MLPLKYTRNFWRTHEMPVINCEITLDLMRYANSILLSNAENLATTFAINNTKHYLQVVTLSTQDNAKLLQQLNSGFKRTINQNKYHSNVSP